MEENQINVLDRKLFYIQSKLLEDGDNQSTKAFFVEAQLWFQPRHYLEVIEERSNEGRCGYPSCCSPITRPSDVSAILKISYKEKRLYELGRSKLFCCSTCLQNSAVYEASLHETHPASRKVAIDFLKRSKENLYDVSSETVSSDYFNESINVESDLNRGNDIGTHTINKLAAVPKLTTPKPNSTISSATVTTTSKNNFHAPGSKNRTTKASDRTSDVPNVLVQSKTIEESTRESNQNILSIIERKPVPVQPMTILSSSENSSFSSLISSSSSLPTFDYSKKIISPGMVEEREKGKSKKVNFTLASLESSVEEKWVAPDYSAPVRVQQCETAPGVTFPVTKMNIDSSMSSSQKEKYDEIMNYKIDFNSKLSGSNTTIIKEQKHPILIVKENDIRDKHKEDKEVLSSSSISSGSGSISSKFTISETILSERITPSNVIREGIKQKNDGTDDNNDLYHDRNNGNNEMDDNDIYSKNFEENLSLFMLLWTTLDDLFGECHSIITSTYPIGDSNYEVLVLPESCNLNGSHDNNNNNNNEEDMAYITGIIVRAKDDIYDNNDNQIDGSGRYKNEDEKVRDRERLREGNEEDVPMVRESIDTTLLPSQRSVAMFIQRGFLTAEKSLDLFSYISLEGLVRYRAVKDLVLTSAQLQESVCPRLKSSEFAILCLLLIDAIVVSQCLLINTETNDWESNLKLVAGKILRVRAGRTVVKENMRTLRAGDLELLRNFFPRTLM